MEQIAHVGQTSLDTARARYNMVLKRRHDYRVDRNLEHRAEMESKKKEKGYTAPT